MEKGVIGVNVLFRLERIQRVRQSNVAKGMLDRLITIARQEKVNNSFRPCWVGYRRNQWPYN
jgi:hypothetical protein